MICQLMASSTGMMYAKFAALSGPNISAGGAEFWDSEPAPARLEAMKRSRYVFLVGYGKGGKRCMRMNIGCSRQMLSKALNQIAEAISNV